MLTTTRQRALLGALLVIGVALLSPLEEMSHALASAHMVQHLLLILLAAPLLAIAFPLAAGTRGLSPTTAWLLHTLTIWFWHAPGPYTAAVVNPLLHGVEHLSFLVTALLFWGKLEIGRRQQRTGLGILLVFAMTLQSVFLSVLLTFAESPWYWVYEATTQAHGLDPLADQQLAGVIMWVPAGLAYTAIGLAFLVGWIREQDSGSPVSSPTVP
jgi:cytochrome c oxidase assembly factor CtaG